MRSGHSIFPFLVLYIKLALFFGPAPAIGLIFGSVYEINLGCVLELQLSLLS